MSLTRRVAPWAVRARDLSVPTAPCTYEGEPSEATFMAIKPDAVQRGLVGKIITRFEDRGFKLLGMKLVTPSRSQAEAHYAEHSSKPFFARACRFLCSGPVVCMVWEGRDVIKTSRTMIGVTEPLESTPGTIRGDFGAHWRRNIIHGSDSAESAAREIGIWFDRSEIQEWDHVLAPWMYELPDAKISWD